MTTTLLLLLLNNIVLIIFMALINICSYSSAIAATNPTTTSPSSSGNNQDDDIIDVATHEMQKANYFTFVMLINMAGPSSHDLITQGQGITFLMPNDKTLSKTIMSESSVLDFLLRHSIPSPLLIDHLDHFPTGSMIPTSNPGFMFKVTNNGRRRFFLSNVRITSPNICTKASYIRCHGIDGVVQPQVVNPQPNLPPPMAPACFNYSSTPWPAAAPSPPSLADGDDPITASSPPSDVDVSNPKSSTSPRIIIGHAGIFFDLVMALFMLVGVGLWF